MVGSKLFFNSRKSLNNTVLRRPNIFTADRYIHSYKQSDLTGYTSFSSLDYQIGFSYYHRQYFNNLDYNTDTCIFIKKNKEFRKIFNIYTEQVPNRYSTLTSTKIVESLYRTVMCSSLNRKYVLYTGLFSMFVQFSDNDENFINIHRKKIDISKLDLDCCFTMMYKNNHQSYVHLSIINNEMPDTEVLEFWVDSRFREKKKNSFTTLKSLVNKLVIPLIEDMGIKIVYKDNLTSHIFEEPLKIKAKSISEYNSTIKNILQNITI